MPMKGVKKHTDRLRKLAGPQMEKALEAALLKAARAIQEEARESIGRGSVSGKPSKPGTAPNRVTGKLQEQIKVTQPEPLVARITSHAEYSAVHEFGTSTHPARPFMRPARDKTLKKVRKGAVAEVDKVVKRSG